MKRKQFLLTPLMALASCVKSIPNRGQSPHLHGPNLYIKKYRYPFADVRFANTGESPIFIYDEVCSWGFGALTAEFSDGSHSVIARRSKSFSVNRPTIKKLNPGDEHIFSLSLHAGYWTYSGKLPSSLSSWRIRWTYKTLSPQLSAAPAHNVARHRLVVPLLLHTEWINVY